MAWESMNNQMKNHYGWGDDPQIVITKECILLNEAFVVLFDVKTNLNIVIDRQNKRLGFFNPKHDLDRANSYKVSDESKKIRRVSATRVVAAFQKYAQRLYSAILNSDTGIIEVNLTNGLSSPESSPNPV